MQAGFAGMLALGLTIRHASATWSGVRWLPAVALCFVVAACGAGTGSPSATGVASPSAAGPTSTTPARADDSQGPYRLVFELPRTDWHTSDAITGEATLSLVGSGGVDFGASGGGPVAFAFDEVGGTRHVAPAWTADCKSYHLDAGQSMSSPITKSGAYSGDASPTDFNRWFLTDPLVHLPVGDWTITAVAVLEGYGCSGTAYTLHAAVVVHVTA